MTETREQVFGKIRELASSYRAELPLEFLTAVADWHLCGLEAARTEVWIPGTAEQSNPVVEELVRRFHLHGFKEKIIQLQERISCLTDRQMKLIKCVRFYAAGPWDGGRKARMLLETPVSAPLARGGRVGYTA